MKQKYGISREEYERRFIQQDGKCAICRTPKAETLCVDHCHKTEKIRGLLCRQCNRAIGLFGEDVEKLLAAVRYLNESDADEPKTKTKTSKPKGN
jgi:hypothetical protein